LIAALALSAERGEAELGLRLCCALRSPWVAYGDVTEGSAWFDRFLGLDDPVSPGVRSRALMLRAELAFEQQEYAAAAGCAQAGIDLCRSSGGTGEAGGHRMLALVSLRAGQHEQALSSAEAAVAAARAAGDDWEEGLAHAASAAVLARQGKFDDAQAAYETALEVLRDNNGWGVAQTLHGLGELARARREHDAALRHFGAALALYRSIDARPEIVRCLAGIGWVALSQRNLELARSSLTESMQLSLATGRRLAIARGLEALGVLALAEGDPARTIRLEGAGLALREAAGHVSPVPARARIDALFDAARQRLGTAASAAMLAEGRAMTRYEAIRLGTEPASAARADGARADGAGGPSVLTARELEIAALIARGLTNRGIADELVISPLTVARHVANIFAKLGCSSRTQVAAWVADRDAGRGS
jgi:DNA-binding CsgD family transcriptional regulator